MTTEEKIKELRSQIEWAQEDLEYLKEELISQTELLSKTPEKEKQQKTKA